MAVDQKGHSLYADVIRWCLKRPDTVVYYLSTSQFMLNEVIVSHETKIEKQHTVMVDKYEDVVTNLRQEGYTVRFCAEEVGARGDLSKSITVTHCDNWDS